MNMYIYNLHKRVLERDGYRDQIVTRLHYMMWVCLLVLYTVIALCEFKKKKKKKNNMDKM